MLDRHIIGLATWLGKPLAFLAIVGMIAAGLALGVVASFNDHWALGFNLFLSIAALIISAIILVAGAKDTAAIQVKLDELIRAVDKADDKLIGIDQKSTEELELARVHVPDGAEAAQTS